MNKIEWTKEMDQNLIKYYKKLGTAETARRMGISRYLIASRADWLGLTNKRDYAYFESADANDLKIRDVKRKVRVGDRVRGKLVIGIYPSFILVTNGKYKETFSWLN